MSAVTIFCCIFLIIYSSVFIWITKKEDNDELVRMNKLLREKCSERDHWYKMWEAAQDTIEELKDILLVDE